MQETLLRFFVVAFGLLISSRDNPGLNETDEILFLEDRMASDRSDQEVENLFLDQKIPDKNKESSELLTIHGDDFEMVRWNKTKLQGRREEEVVDEWTQDLLWLTWNILSFISSLCILGKYIMKKSRKSAAPISAGNLQLPDSDDLLVFYSKHIHRETSALRQEEFLDGFLNDLLASTRVVCERSGGVTVQDFKAADICDVAVPLVPLEPYTLQCVLRKDDVLCGQVKVASESPPNGCYCQTSEDDMVCLLHGEAAKRSDRFARRCVKNTRLSKSQTIRWFCDTLKQAWGQISHKYDFEVIVGHLDAPCSLVVRFKSGKKLRLKLNPVVELNRGAHLCITHNYSENSDSLWTLSLKGYEDWMLDYFSRQLPRDACHMQVLQIAHFLHRRQVDMTGLCFLSEHHFKTALIHLLLTTKSGLWRSDRISSRLRGLLAFVWEAVQNRRLHHAVVGNRSAQRLLQLPAELAQATSLNLFHPLVVHKGSYRHTVAHYREILRNSRMLILDYVGLNDV